jgi:hypothetical protein
VKDDFVRKWESYSGYAFEYLALDHTKIISGKA